MISRPVEIGVVCGLTFGSLVALAQGQSWHAFSFAFLVSAYLMIDDVINR